MLSSLLQKLADIDLNPCIVRCIEDYLTKREQFFVVEGASTAIVTVISAWSPPKDLHVLGPLLFIAYINDIVYQISSNIVVMINIFADDIALYGTITSADDYTAHQEDIDAVSCTVDDTCDEGLYQNKEAGWTATPPVFQIFLS